MYRNLMKYTFHGATMALLDSFVLMSLRITV